MEKFHNPVTAYLRTNAALFLNSDYQLPVGDLAISDIGGIDIVAVDFGSKSVWLCVGGPGITSQEVMKKLRSWQVNWPLVEMALWRNCRIPVGFEIRPWVFVEGLQRQAFEAAFAHGDLEGVMPSPRLTALEDLPSMEPPAFRAAA